MSKLFWFGCLLLVASFSPLAADDTITQTLRLN